jgi:hypothetical protein
MFRGIHFDESADTPFVLLHDGDDAPVVDEAIQEVPRQVRVGEMWQRH